MNEKIHSLLRENRMCIFGLSLIWIFFRHTFFYNQFSFGLFDYVTQIGDAGVDIFMFLSAYGLSFSYGKNRNKRIFYEHRLLRIVPSVAVLLFIFAVIDTCLFGASIYHCINLRYWFFSLYSTYWFIGAILLFYVLFPYIYDLLTSYHYNELFLMGSVFVLSILLIASIIFSHVGILQQLTVYFARIPILIIGILWASKNLWNKTTVDLCLLISIPLIYFLPKDYQRVSYSLLTVGFIYYIPQILNKIPSTLKKIIAYVGVCSLEFYLIHIYLLKNNILGRFEPYIHSQLLTSLIVLCIVIIMAVIANRLIGIITHRIKCR